MHCNEQFQKEPRFRLARNATATTVWGEILINRDEYNALNHTFSNKLPDAKICNQKQSGRCWLFAACTLMRRAMQKKFNLPDDFELSQTYLFFHDKLERCNFILECILQTAAEPTDSRLVQYLLTDPTNDGGQWEMIVNIVNKYGVVPKSVFKECSASEGSLRLNIFLKTKLREFACVLRTKHAEGIDMVALRAEKMKMMEIIHRILIIHLGNPPTSFDFNVYDKDKKFISYENMTPKKFYEEIVPMDVNEYVSVVNDPRNPYNRALTVDKLGNVVGGLRVFYINTSIEDLWKYAKQTIETGEPVWFGCDVGKSSSLKTLGIMSTKIYDYDLVFGTEPKLNKKERMEHHESVMTHAMVFTGFDVRSNEEKPRKWRVENSWGTERGENGYDIMTSEWFDEHMYQVVVNKKILKEEHENVLTLKDPIVLPPWDPMGSLA